MRLVNLCSVRYVTPDCVHILHTPHTHATRIHHQYSESIVLLCSHHELDLTKIGECKISRLLCQYGKYTRHNGNITQ